MEVATAAPAVTEVAAVVPGGKWWGRGGQRGRHRRWGRRRTSSRGAWAGRRTASCTGPCGAPSRVSARRQSPPRKGGHPVRGRGRGRPALGVRGGRRLEDEPTTDERDRGPRDHHKYYLTQHTCPSSRWSLLRRGMLYTTSFLHQASGPKARALAQVAPLRTRITN